MKSYFLYWENYFNFSGRSKRSEYWIPFFIHFPFSILLLIMDASVMISLFFTLITIIPGLAVSIRRLHDTNRSGWWILISLIPFIGIIWLIILMCLESKEPEKKEISI